MEAAQEQWVDTEAEAEVASEAEDALLAGAWTRLWARALDLTVVSFPIAFLIGILFPTFFAAPVFAGPAGDLLANLFIIPLALIADACIVSIWGRSLGKLVAGLVVRDRNGEKPSLDVALSRNLRVYFRGYVMGIPLLNLVGFVSAYNSVAANGTTSWDDETDTYVVAVGNSTGRTVLTAALYVGLQILIQIAVTS